MTFKILNPESVAKQWSDIKVRYYFTPTMPLAPMVTFDFLQKFTASQLTTHRDRLRTSRSASRPSAGMVTGFDNVTGSDEIQLHLYNYTTPTWNTSQTDDYSYKACAGVREHRRVHRSAHHARLLPGPARVGLRAVTRAQPRAAFPVRALSG